MGSNRASRPLYGILLCVTFSLRISVNYMENVTELLVHVRTVDTRCSPRLAHLSTAAMHMCSTKHFWYSRVPGNEAKPERERVTIEILRMITHECKTGWIT